MPLRFDPILGKLMTEQDVPVAGVLTAISTNYTLTTADGMLSVDASGGERTILCPDDFLDNPEAFGGYFVGKSDSSANKVILSGTFPAYGETELSLESQGDCVLLVPGKTGWFVAAF